MRKQNRKSVGFCSFAFTVLLVFSFAQTLSAQVSKRTTGALITPGQGVGQVKLGDSLEQVFRLYPKLKPSNSYKPAGCALNEMELPGSVTIYLKNKRIIQIVAAGNYGGILSQTADKISAGSTAALVKSRYPNAGKTFTKLDSVAVSTGYAPLIYWVDENAGIGFEFYTDQTKGRLVNKIHVFTPGERMKFGGSCENDDDLRELPSFTTRIPEKMIQEYENQPED